MGLERRIGLNLQEEIEALIFPTLIKSRRVKSKVVRLVSTQAFLEIKKCRIT